ncbi:ABC transporter permease, partial [Escherichia coli]
NEVIVSGKIATDLGLKVKDSIVAIFSKEDQKPVYRKFEVAGIYKTDIKLIDDLFVIGDINQVRKIQGMEKSDIGGLDIYLKDIDDIDKEYP